MENTQDRETLIKNLVRAGVIKYVDYLKEMNYTIDHKTFEEVMEVFEMGLDYEETSNSFYGLIDYLKMSKLIDKNNLYKTSIKAVNVVLEQIENNQITEDTLKGYELTKEKIKGLITYYGYFDKTEDSFNKYEEYIQEQTSKKEKIYKTLEEQYTNYLKGVNEKNRKKRVIEDIEKAVNVIEDDYLGNFKEDLEKTNITVLVEMTHNFRCFEKGKQFVKGLNTLYWYLYPFFRNYELLTYFDDRNFDITDQLISYTELLINSIDSDVLIAEPLEQEKQIKYGIFGGNTITTLVNGVKNALTISASKSATTTEKNEFIRHETIMGNKLLLQDVLKKAKQTSKYGVNAEKIMTVITSQFGAQNTLVKKSKVKVEKANKIIYIDLLAYGELLGKKLKITCTDNYEKQKEEEEEIKNVKKELVRTLDEDLSNIRNSYFRYSEKKGDKPWEFGLIQEYSINSDQNFIYVNLTDRFAEICLNSEETKKTQIPVCLFKISGRSKHTWAIGVYLARIFNMPLNIQNHRNNIIKVNSLLSQTSLPSMEELDKIKRVSDWYKRILIPFEKALDQLLNEDEGGVGFLKQWTYCHEKGRELTKKEVNDWKNKKLTYGEWVNWYITFTPNESAISEHTKNLILDANEKEKLVIDNEQ